MGHVYIPALSEDYSREGDLILRHEKCKHSRESFVEHSKGACERCHTAATRSKFHGEICLFFTSHYIALHCA